MSSLVSVVIPTYNRAHDLGRALDSVLKQTYPYWEAVVIDNHSTDNTHEVVHGLKDARINSLKITNNGVIAASRNLGIRHATGEFIAFLDSDDFWAADKLDKSISWLGRGFDIVYHDMRIISNKRFRIGRRKFLTRQLVSPVLNDLLIYGNTLPTSSVVVRKAVLDQVGGFREDLELIAGEDYDLWLRLSGLTQRFKRIDGTLGYLTKGSENEFSSARLLSIICEVERRYISGLSAEEQHQAHVNWIDYAHARSQYVQSNYDDAQNRLRKLLTTSSNRSFRIKAMFMLFVIAVRKSAGLTS